MVKKRNKICDAGVPICTYGYMCIFCMQKIVYEQLNAYHNLFSSGKSWIKIVYATLFHLLVSNHYDKVQLYCHIFISSSILALCNTHKWCSNKCPVVKKEIVCISCLIHISENWSSWRQEEQGLLLSLGGWALGW